MLGKLIKHEWKSVYKIGCVILAAILAVTLLGCIFLRTPLIGFLFTETNEFSMQDFGLLLMGIMSFVVYVLLLMAAVYGIMIYFGVHFYRTMYTDEGYLTHTLPVTSHQLLISKTLVSGIWMLLIELAVIGSVFVLAFSFIIGISQGSRPEITVNFRDIWDELSAAIQQAFTSGEGLDFIHYHVVLVLTYLTGPFTALLVLFGALTIGQLSRKYKVMMGIVTYIGLLILNAIISSLVQLCTSLAYAARSAYTDSDLSSGYMLTTYDISLVIGVLVGLILYFLSHYIICQKLNLE